MGCRNRKPDHLKKKVYTSLKTGRTTGTAVGYHRPERSRFVRRQLSCSQDGKPGDRDLAVGRGAHQGGDGLLHARFQELDNDSSGIISRKEFLAIPELTLNPLSDRIIHAFFKGSENDLMDFRSFVKILARFRPIGKDDNDKHNKKMDKLRFAFSMYDLDGDGSLNQAVSLLLNTGTRVKSVSLRK